jgi:hypothetical protein
VFRGTSLFARDAAGSAALLPKEESLTFEVNSRTFEISDFRFPAVFRAFLGFKLARLAQCSVEVVAINSPDIEEES